MTNISKYIAKKYILVLKNKSIINIINIICITSISISTTCMFIILSIFSGLEKINIKYYNNFTPDIIISPKYGKKILNIRNLINKINNNNDIDLISKIINEKAYIQGSNNNTISYIKGVDSNFQKIFNIDTCMIFGNYLDKNNLHSAIISTKIANDLNINYKYSYDIPERINIIIPNLNKQLYNNKIKKIDSNISGIFELNEMYQNYILLDIKTVQNLLGNKDYISDIYIKIKKNKNLTKVKYNLNKLIGNDYIIKTKYEVNKNILKIINMEKLIIYIIFSLIVLISSFNIISSIIIIYTQKKADLIILEHIGCNKNIIKKIFFHSGLYITYLSIVIGILIGSIIGWIQKKFNIITALENIPFPFEFTIINYIIVPLTVLLIGIVISVITSNKIK